MTGAGKWADLRLRVLSGTVVLVLGFAALWAGGLPLRLMAAAGAGVMIWELAGLSAPGRPRQALGIAALAALSAGLFLIMHGQFWLVLLPLPSVLLIATRRRDRFVTAFYGGLVMLACYAMVAFREGYGLGFVTWVALIVIASDVMGYFGGRIIGGPKFWPAVSPKKTWAGTVAGWVGAAAVGLGAVIWAGQGGFVIWVSALTAFAAQMGDIAESAIKRRAGAKDSSRLIPGHGGFLDRFDALIGAAVFVIFWGMAQLPLPVFGG